MPGRTSSAPKPAARKSRLRKAPVMGGAAGRAQKPKVKQPIPVVKNGSVSKMPLKKLIKKVKKRDRVR